MDNQRIGEVIKSRRLELEMSLDDVGKNIGVNRSTVLRWERGDIKTMRSTHVYLLSKILYLPLETLIGIDNDKPVEKGDVVVKRLDVINSLNKLKTIEDLEQVKRFIENFVIKK